MRNAGLRGCGVRCTQMNGPPGGVQGGVTAPLFGLQSPGGCKVGLQHRSLGTALSRGGEVHREGTRSNGPACEIMDQHRGSSRQRKRESMVLLMIRAQRIKQGWRDQHRGSTAPAHGITDQQRGSIAPACESMEGTQVKPTHEAV